jgi:hypothetical protein
VNNPSVESGEKIKDTVTLAPSSSTREFIYGREQTSILDGDSVERLEVVYEPELLVFLLDAKPSATVRRLRCLVDPVLDFTF